MATETSNPAFTTEQKEYLPFSNVLAMGVLLGIAGASFGVALSLLAPRLATHFGWQHIYGFAAAVMLLPLLVMIFLAKEPPDHEHLALREHPSCLFEKDGWYFNLVYIITFGGFMGLATFLPSFFYAQFHITKIQAGELTVTGHADRERHPRRRRLVRGSHRRCQHLSVVFSSSSPASSAL